MPTSLAVIRKTVAVGPGGTSCRYRFPQNRGWRRTKLRGAQRNEGRITFRLNAAND